MWETIVASFGRLWPWVEILQVFMTGLMVSTVYRFEKLLWSRKEEPSDGSEKMLFETIQKQLGRIEALEGRILDRVPNVPISIAPSDPVVHELDRVTLLSAQTDRAGTTVPEGSVGTVVAVLKDGQAYMVEFVEPIAALVTVRAGLVAPMAKAA